MTAHTDHTPPSPRDDGDPDTPHAKKAARETGKPDQLREKERHAEARGSLERFWDSGAG